VPMSMNVLHRGNSSSTAKPRDYGVPQVATRRAVDSTYIRGGGSGGNSASATFHRRWPQQITWAIYHDGYKPWRPQQWKREKLTAYKLLRNRQIHGEFTAIPSFRKHTCGRHGCGCRGHCLWLSLSNPDHFTAMGVTSHQKTGIPWDGLRSMVKTNCWHCIFLAWSL